MIPPLPLLNLLLAFSSPQGLQGSGLVRSVLRFSRSDIGHYRRWGSPICRRFLQWTTLVHLALVLIERPERYVGGYLDDIPSALSPAIEAVVLCAYAVDLAAFLYFGGRLSILPRAQKVFHSSRLRFLATVVLVILAAEVIASAVWVSGGGSGGGGGGGGPPWRLARALRIVFVPLYWPWFNKTVVGLRGVCRGLLPSVLLLIVFILFFATLLAFLMPAGCDPSTYGGNFSSTQSPAVALSGAFPGGIGIGNSTRAGALLNCSGGNTSRTMVEDFEVDCGTSPLQCSNYRFNSPAVGAQFAPGNVYFFTFHRVVMELCFLLLGAVNYPDITYPGMIAMHDASVLIFILFTIGGMILLNANLAIVFEEYKFWSTKRWIEEYVQYRSALISAFFLADYSTNSRLDFAEFRRLMAIVRPDIQQNGLLQCFDDGDKEGDHLLAPEEFLQVCDAVLVKPEGELSWVVQTPWDIPNQPQCNHSRELLTKQHEDYRRTSSLCGRCWNGGGCPQLRVLLLNSTCDMLIHITVILSTITVFVQAVAASELLCFDPNAWRVLDTVLFCLEWGFSIIFLLEMTVKMLACGVHGYWKTPWFRLDGIITIATTITLLPETVLFGSMKTTATAGSGSGLGLGLGCLQQQSGGSLRISTILRFFRSLRLLRSIRLVSTFGPFRVVLSALFRFTPFMPEYFLLL